MSEITSLEFLELNVSHAERTSHLMFCLNIIVLVILHFDMQHGKFSNTMNFGPSPNTQVHPGDSNQASKHKSCHIFSFLSLFAYKR